jgi:hypothetical protein
MSNKQPNKTLLRKERAKQREAISSTQTPVERLAVLDQRLGIEVGAKKERARLSKLIKESKKHQ